MTFATEVRKTVTDSAPVYAVVGATDLAVEKVREARTRAAAARTELAAGVLQDKAAAQASKVAGQVQQVPAIALNRTLEIAAKAQDSYDSLVVRGERLVKRLREQQATKDLVDSANTTLAKSRGAVTTARKAALDTRRAARATLTTGRHQAEKVAGVVGDTLQEDAATIATSVKESTAATRTSARRTATTARKRAAGTRTATKAATTSARKAAAGTGKVATTSAAKIGD